MVPVWLCGNTIRPRPPLNVRIGKLRKAIVGHASRAEQPSQIFSFLGSLKLVRHVRCYPNSGQIVAVPRLSALCQSRPTRRNMIVHKKKDRQLRRSLRNPIRCFDQAPAAPLVLYKTAEPIMQLEDDVSFNRFRQSACIRPLGNFTCASITYPGHVPMCPAAATTGSLPLPPCRSLARCTP